MQKIYKLAIIIIIVSIISLLVIIIKDNSNKLSSDAQREPTQSNNTVSDQSTKDMLNIKDITDVTGLVKIAEVVNREDLTPNGDKAQYVYELPIINIDKPGAQKINAKFLALEKDQEARIGNGQSMTINIKSKAFLNDGIISVVMTIVKPGPGGIYAVNYDIENDKEVSTKELLDKYEFDSQKLIAEINKQVKINENIPIEERDFISIDDFVYTILDSASLDSSSNNVLIDFESVRNKPQDEKENYVLDNINKIQAYLNNDGNFVFVHLAELMDEELVVER